MMVPKALNALDENRTVFLFGVSNHILLDIGAL